MNKLIAILSKCHILKLVMSLLLVLAGDSKHRICIHSRGDGVTELMDSLGSFMPLGRMTLLRIAKIFKGDTGTKYLKLKVLPVQQNHQC